MLLYEIILIVARTKFEEAKKVLEAQKLRMTQLEDAINVLHVEKPKKQDE